MGFMTIAEASLKLKIGKQVIYYEIRKGNIKKTKYGGRVLIDEEAFKYLKNKEREKKKYLTVNQYCKKYRIGRGAFNYRVSQGFIRVIFVDGSVFVKELKGK